MRAFVLLAALAVLSPGPLRAETSAAPASLSPAARSSHRAPRAVIELAKGGRIVIRFFPHEAPRTVANFIKLADRGFYNGLTFHRVVPGFVVQGGDPNGDGTGGPGYTIKAEFNDHRHLRGTVAMARTSDPDSAGSQFYICLAPLPQLDHQYTVFGQVVKGDALLDTIRPGDRMKRVFIER